MHKRRCRESVILGRAVPERGGLELGCERLNQGSLLPGESSVFF